jgi:ABC-type glycerol-3-phosphate transport system substrate-binding protein
MTGCSKSGETKSSPSPSAAGTAAASPTAAAKSEYVIKYMVPGGDGKLKRSDETEIGKVIKDKFNIVIEYIPYAGNWDEKTNLMLAAKDYPEILWVQGNINFKKYQQAGALVALDEYLPQAKNFSQRWKEQIPFWQALSTDKKLYKWEFGNFDSTSLGAGNDIWVRIDALEKQGYPNLVSEDDWVKFLKQAMKDFPTAKDGSKTIGMTAPFGEAYGMAGIAGILYEKGGKTTGVGGNEGVLFSSAENKFLDYFKSQDVVDSFKWFNRLYREGILDPESFTDKVPQVREKTNSGRSISSWYSGTHNNNQIKTSGRPDQQYIMMPIQSNRQIQNKEQRLMMELDIYPFYSMVITKNAKDPKRIVELLDWFASEEGQILMQVGIEGKHYTVQNGNRVPTDFYKAETKNPDSRTGLSAGNWFIFGQDKRAGKDGKPYSFGYDPQFRDELVLTPETLNAYQKLGWKSSTEWWQKNGKGAKVGLIGNIKLDPGSEFTPTYQKMVDHRVKNTPKLIMAKSEAEFDQIYKELLAEYEKLNPQKVIDKFNEMYQAELNAVKK